MIAIPGLTKDQVDEFHTEGCLVLPNELTPDRVKCLLAESHRLLEEFPLNSHPMTKFTTGEGIDGRQKHVGDDYFLDSSHKVSFFFEEHAFDSKGNLTKPKDKVINKIGHALHDLLFEFKQVSETERNKAIADSLGFKDPRILQSMVICKQPEIGAEVPTHQDATFLYTEPQSAVGFWYALEDCTPTNGALEFVPGSHDTPIAQRFVRRADGKGTEFIDIEGVEKYTELSNDKFKLLDCPAGSLVLIHNSVLHRSSRNISQKSRYAYTFHVIDGSCKYDERNWLQLSSGPENFTRL
jgi:hypothetical protein